MPLGKRGIQRAEAYAVVDAAAEKLAHGQESADAAFYECLRTAVYDVIGIALGVNVVIATATGRGDAEAVRRTVHTAVTMSVVCGALIAAAGELAAPALLGMMNVPGEVLPHALTYLRIYLLGMPVILLYNFESAIFRSVGETAVPLRALFMSGILTSAAVAAALLLAGERLMAVFNSEPEVIAVGCMRLRIVFAAYAFTVLYEVMSGYLRGFGISLVPAVLTTLGVCGVRILWVAAVFPLDRTFKTVMLAYPASLAATALLMLATLLYYRPSRRFADRAHRRTKPCTAPDGEQKTSQTRRFSGASVTIRSI